MSHASHNGIWLSPLHYRALQRVRSSGTLRFGCKQLNQILELSLDERSGVMDVSATQEDQCPTSQIPTFQFGHPHRCISARVDGISRQHNYWGGTGAQKNCGFTSMSWRSNSIPGKPRVHKKLIVSTSTHSPTHQQHNCSGVYQHERGNTLPISIGSSSRTLVLHSRKGILGDSNTYPRNPQ